MNAPDTPPQNDATPSGNGASVNSPNDARNRTHLPLIPPAHHNAPSGTSEVAASRIAGHAAQQRADVLAAIVKAGAHGATDAEIESATGIRAQSVSPRRGELRTLGAIVDSGRRRLTPRGRPAAVWIASTFATIGPAASADAPKPEGGAA
ncbi:MAG: hypothetical protein KF912_07980 [Phycisphaeraceae bacterium]|nr:hypothetical protein [Phycisphaeraceae bacterium]MBX3367240.1 hypothetical protein [Phycisphaeraceae bacterium]